MKSKTNPLSMCIRALFVMIFAVALTSPTLATAEEAAKAPQMTAISVQQAAGEGKPIEVKVLIETPSLKLAALTLRAGTLLPEHTAPVPVTIQVVSGSGTITTAGVKEELSVGQMVYLVAEAPHEILPAKGSDLVLMVHYLRGDAAPKAEKKPCACEKKGGGGHGH